MKKNKNSLLLDVQYVRGNKANKQPDCLYTIYRDLDTMEKKLEVIPEPKMTIYFEKEEERDHEHNLTYREIEKLNPVTCKYKDIKFAIAQEQGESGKKFLQNIFETRNYGQLKYLNEYPYVFGHDYDVRTWYRYAWDKAGFKPKKRILTKGFMDIEVDGSNVEGFPDPQHCPIDLVTVIDSNEMKSYTFALINQEYKMKDLSHIQNEVVRNELEAKEKEKKERAEHRIEQEQYLVNHTDKLKEELHDMFDESYGELEYNFYFYEDEKKMLVHLFQLINKLKLDFMMVWNISFDIPYIMDRMKYLGLDPKEVICHPDFPVKECYFVADKRNFDIKNKSDFFHVSSYTVYYDQMILYAAIRKGREELRSNKLNFIAEKEIGDQKLDYEEEGNFKDFSYVNYWKYFIYNIKDVLLQNGIERSTADIDTLYVTSYENLSQYKDVFKQTVVLRNVQYKSFMSKGLVPGANLNALHAYDEKVTFDDGEDEDDEATFEGALVGNPLLISDFGVAIYGDHTNYLFDYSIDMDMKAFYPNTIHVLNIDVSTLIFKCIVDPSQYDVRGGTIPYHGITDVQLAEQNSDSFQNDIANEIFDNFQTRNYLSVGYKFLNLPSVDEMAKIIKERLG